MDAYDIMPEKSAMRDSDSVASLFVLNMNFSWPLEWLIEKGVEFDIWIDWGKLVDAKVQAVAQAST